MKCLRCRNEKAHQEFPWKNKAWNIRSKVCKSCETRPPNGVGLVGCLSVAWPVSSRSLAGDTNCDGKGA